MRSCAPMLCRRLQRTSVLCAQVRRPVCLTHTRCPPLAAICNQGLLQLLGCFCCAHDQIFASRKHADAQPHARMLCGLHR